MKRIPFFPLLALSGLTLVGCASTASEEPPPPPPEEPAAEAACTAWALDITNFTRLELQVYEFRGDTTLAPSRRNKGHLIRFVRPRGRGSTLLFGARPAVMIYAFQEATNAVVVPVVDSTGTVSWEEVAPDRPERSWRLGVASPDRKWPAWQAPRVGLKFTCVSN